jgi:hypothetical protein
MLTKSGIIIRNVVARVYGCLQRPVDSNKVIKELRGDEGDYYPNALNENSRSIPSKTSAPTR